MLDSTLGRLEREFVAYCKKYGVEGSIKLGFTGGLFHVKLSLSAPQAQYPDIQARETDFGGFDQMIEDKPYDALVDLNGHNHRGTPPGV